MALLGDLEHQVMTVLWRRNEPLSVRDVHEQIAAERDLAYTTVMTVLDRLAKKGLAHRTLDGRAWLYRPARSCVELHAEEILSLLDACGPDACRAIWEQVNHELSLRPF